MKVGLVSDTHSYLDPRLCELLDGVGKILHAGDVGSQRVLDHLSLVAPTAAVKGNVDSPDLNLPLSLTLQVEGVQVEIRHILPALPSQLESWSRAKLLQKADLVERDRFLECFQPSTRVVLFGHSHEPCLVCLTNRLFVNPGSAGKKRFALPRCCGVMEIARDELEVKILLLEDYNRSVPEPVHLRFKRYVYREKH
ncbi:MAG: metallophosphoesterase family protein [Terriglobia bacterium]